MIRPLAALLVPVVAATACTVWQSGAAQDALRPVDESVAADALSIPLAETVTTEPAPRRTASRSGARTGVVRAEEEQRPQLTVSMDSLTPGAIPRSSPVVATGRISNRTDEAWEGINVYACTSRSPMTTTHEVEHAATLPADEAGCERTEVFQTIERLEPGETQSYRLEVQRDQLGIGRQRGVYWFSVQVLGTNTAGRDQEPDGSARAFLPLVEYAPATVPVSLVLPVRRSVLHDADGRITDTEGWVGDLTTGGRLSNVLSLAEAAPDGEVSLLVDPAVVATAGQLADGNLPRTLGPGGAKPDAGIDADGRRAAGDWLERFLALARTQRILALPYGDVDVSAASRSHPSFVVRALAQSRTFFNGLDIDAEPVVAPPTGYLEDSALERVGGATVLLSDKTLPRAYADRSPTPDTVRVDGHVVRVYSSSLATGGPGPTDGLKALALRQRILADAAVRALAYDARPLLVMPSASLDPGRSTHALFDELDRGFIDLTTSLHGADPAPEVGRLAYPAAEAKDEQGRLGLAAADRLIELGGILDRMLPEDAGVSTTATREALSAVSYGNRGPDLAGQTAAAASANWFAQRLADVEVSVPPFVILSSGRGTFAMTVTNDLDQPVRLGIRAVYKSDIVISAPKKTVEVPENSRVTVNLSAESDTIGVHPVVIVITDEAGKPVQQTREISIRINQVGRVIWVIMGIGVALLVVAIGVRLRLRRRLAKAGRQVPRDGDADGRIGEGVEA